MASFVGKMSLSTFTVGQRVRDGDGFRCTIRYIGPVATSKSAATLYAGAQSGSPPRSICRSRFVDARAAL